MKKNFFRRNQGYIVYSFIVLLIVIGAVIKNYTVKERTPEQIQLSKVVTVRLDEGGSITLTGYALFDKDKEFRMNDSVYVEYNKKNAPSSLRHLCDGYIKDGQGYGITTCCGAYPATLRKGMVIEAYQN